MNTSSRQRLHPRPIRPSLFSEYLGFLRHSGKWWLFPIMIVTMVLGLLVFLGGTGAAPFIYTLF